MRQLNGVYTQVRIPDQIGQLFRGKPATHSGVIRPPFRSKPATPFGLG
jgi:hypothetical protein